MENQDSCQICKKKNCPFSLANKRGPSYLIPYIKKINDDELVWTKNHDAEDARVAADIKREGYAHRMTGHGGYLS